MELSIFLAQVVGWYFVIASLCTLLRLDATKAIMEDILAQRALLFFIAIVTLILGLMMVVSHNVWVMGWPVIITIIGWLVLIGGIVRLFCPDTIMKIWQWWLRNPTYLIVVTVISLLIGVYLLYRAYFG
ncbi:Integral membrane protein (PIN domain superfamily) [Legionella lansingensis]|uniref:Integral membrane protein (PIN domain superfamily) n=1 Tax=Legionella lansingensis TaxID=45067 RepID=A0A0W0VGD5_9GAMM|nr:hypothetical protein [Legionella lansingensis]KTD19151.1 Integral membrane protein (PIN domain superfamily) [Legionella lansingensis]SNV45452.1 Integral membrane protein (PIN domain superfamily) [Legionella lansingensis]